VISVIRTEQYLTDYTNCVSR